MVLNSADLLGGQEHTELVHELVELLLVKTAILVLVVSLFTNAK